MHSDPASRTAGSGSRIASRIEGTLTDAVLGFLALASLFLMLMPAAFAMTPAGLRILDGLDLLIILVFAIEYIAAWYLAEDKRAFSANRWRLLDALIIVAALISLFPFGPNFLRNSPVLRLLRLGRVALLGTRSGFALRAGGDAGLPAPPPLAELAVLALNRTGNAFETIAWDAALKRIGSADPDWLFISGVGEEQLAPIANALGIPEKAVQALFQSSIPRSDRLERFSTLFVRYPLPMQEDSRLRRTPVLLLGAGENVVVLSRDRSDLESQVAARLADIDPGIPRMVKATLALVAEIIRAYTGVVEHLERRLLTLETTHATLKDPAFLARTSELRADILRARSSLKHLKRVVGDLSLGHITLAGAAYQVPEQFRLLADDAEDLYEGIEDLRDSLQALVDLRLNVASFQMNRVMRLLALLTALALIPATAGGLLGMNLQDTPWPATLPQVAFGVAAGMALSLYVFAIKGWLR